MQKGAYKYYKDLPPWAKGVVIVGVGVVAFIVGRKIYKSVFPSKEEKEYKELLRDVDEEINQEKKKGLKQTYSDSNYISFANTIYGGMRYCAGDDYAIVEETMKKMMNDLDVSKLIKAFGQKQNYCFGLPSGNPMDLFTFVNKELGNDWGGLTNYRVKRINENWASKGITYKL